MPPSPLTLYVLLALTVDELDVPGIHQQIAEDTQSIVLASERSLYKAINRLVQEGFTIKVPQTRCYRLTQKGRAVLVSEKHRFGRTTLILHQRVE